MSHTILVLSGGDLGLETMLIRTVLSQPSSPVEINWGQGEGWIPTQFQAAHAYGGLRQLAEMIAFADCENSDDCVCDCDNADYLPIFERARLGLVSRDVADIAEVLIGHGERFAGDDVEGESQHWIDHDFGAAEVADWCDIGCWNPSVAAQWRDAGLTPAIVTTAAEALLASLPEECDPADVYTDGCPIYSCCNDDTDPEVIIACCREVMREFSTNPSRYRAEFTGRHLGAIGVMESHSVLVEGRDENDAREKIAEKYQDIRGLVLTPVC